MLFYYNVNIFNHTLYVICYFCCQYSFFYASTEQWIRYYTFWNLISLHLVFLLIKVAANEKLNLHCFHKWNDRLSEISVAAKIKYCIISCSTTFKKNIYLVFFPKRWHHPNTVKIWLFIFWYKSFERIFFFFNNNLILFYFYMCVTYCLFVFMAVYMNLKYVAYNDEWGINRFFAYIWFCILNFHYNFKLSIIIHIIYDANIFFPYTYKTHNEWSILEQNFEQLFDIIHSHFIKTNGLNKKI